MTLELYKQVVIMRDLPGKQLYRGDVAVLVDFIEHPSSREQGKILEIFNVLDESIMWLLSTVLCRTPASGLCSIRTAVGKTRLSAVQPNYSTQQFITDLVSRKL